MICSNGCVSVVFRVSNVVLIRVLYIVLNLTQASGADYAMQGFVKVSGRRTDEGEIVSDSATAVGTDAERSKDD